jgi:hypothetical protein
LLQVVDVVAGHHLRDALDGFLAALSMNAAIVAKAYLLVIQENNGFPLNTRTWLWSASKSYRPFFSSCIDAPF